MIGSSFGKEKNLISSILYILLIIATVGTIFIQIAIFLMTEQYKEAIESENSLKEDVIEKYVDLVTEYKTAVNIQNKKIKKTVREKVLTEFPYLV